MKYYTKEWYNSGCIFSEKQSIYKQYYEENQRLFPQIYRELSLHDAAVIGVNQDENSLSIKALLSCRKHAVKIILKNQNILEACNLNHKICLADELYIENGNFEFHLLLCDENNELFYFTAKCSDFIVIELPELQIQTLLYYSLQNQLPDSEGYYYDFELKEIVNKGQTDKSVPERRYYPLPHIPERDWLYDFLTRKNSKKINAYLARFQNNADARREAEYEICFLNKSKIIRVADCFGYEYYCLNLFKPIAEKWSKEAGVALDCELTAPENHFFEQETDDSRIYVPTDGICISKAINFCTQKDIVFNKTTYIYGTLEGSFTDNKDFLAFPYCSEKRIQESYTGNSNPAQQNKAPFSPQNAESDYDYRNKYLSSVLIEWCKKNSIKYIENMDDFIPRTSQK